MRRVVVFPAPFGPRRPKISPGATSSEILDGDAVLESACERACGNHGRRAAQSPRNASAEAASAIVSGRQPASPAPAVATCTGHEDADAVPMPASASGAPTRPLRSAATTGTKK